MFFKCKNCGGNILYNPEKHKMVCPYCESEETQEKGEASTYGANVCPNCGGGVPLEQYTSAMICPYCSTSLIVDEKVQDEYRPRRILPFQMGKEACKNLMKERFGKVLFAPTDFCAEARLDGIRGEYVPYWLYDYDTTASFIGEGTKVRVWRTGNIEHREVSYYSIRREMDGEYRMVPADASVRMPDDVMNLIEPYDYSRFVDFKPEYMSGFNSEVYNMPSAEIEDRAKAKVHKSVEGLIQNSYAGYSTTKTISMRINFQNADASYCLLPVWIYDYSYKDKKFPFYVNGQSGKIVGQVPISMSKAFAYSGTLFVSLSAIIGMILYLIKG